MEEKVSLVPLDLTLVAVLWKVETLGPTSEILLQEKSKFLAPNFKFQVY